MYFSRLQYLLDQYAANRCSKTELLELLKLIATENSTEELEIVLKNIWDDLNDLDELPEIDQEKMYASIIATKKPDTNKQSKIWWRIAAAAIATILFGTVLFNFNNATFLKLFKSSAYMASHPIVPGTNKAVLTLADGSKIDLNNSIGQTLGHFGNIKIIKNGNAQITYQVNADKTDAVAQTTYNVLATPKGGQYEIVLSDGSKVVLNANSSLRFPSVFSPDQRTVELNGEAYFEIAKNKRSPFKVMANGTEIKVLGTHFNVMAYHDEACVKTTLVEGSVQVSKNMLNKIIAPGQQARVNNTDHTINISESNVEEALAWKNGYFLFQDESIESVMRKIARWYDVEIIFKDDIQAEEFGGKISRYERIQDVLKPLELTGSVHFKIEGRRIIVTK